MDFKRKLDRLSGAGVGGAKRPPTTGAPGVESGDGQGTSAPRNEVVAPVPGASANVIVPPAAPPAGLEPQGETKVAPMRLSSPEGAEAKVPLMGLSGPGAAEEKVASMRLSGEGGAEIPSTGLAAASPSAPPTEATPPQAAPDPEKQARIAQLRRAMNSLTSRSATVPLVPLPKAEPPSAGAPAPRGELPVESRTTEFGVIHVSDRLYPPHHRHGHAPLSAALEADPSHVATLALDPAFAEVDPGRMLLVDTETTGLAGGAGTLPFLIGLGWFENGALRLHQLFLRRPGEESPMLRFLAERIHDASCLVTYNGKTFDWPLLRTRFVMNRLPVPTPPPHLDLLHIARRVFKYRDGGTRLVRVEEEVLGHRRIGDVDGSLIPELYFRFLRGGSGAALAPVIEHNAHDLVLLAALLGRLAHGLKDGAEAWDPRDRLGLADVAARAEQVERALALARSTAQAAKGSLAADAWTLAAWLLRRQGNARGAAEAFHQALKHADRKQAPALHFALAKLYEHTLRNAARALEHAKHTVPAESAAEQNKRIARLERRLSGQGALLID